MSNRDHFPSLTCAFVMFFCKGVVFVHILFRFFHEGCRMLPLFIPLRGCGAYWGQIQLYSWAKARVHPKWVASSLQDPYWWQWLPHCTSGAILGFSILLKELACCSVPPQGSQGFEPDLPTTGLPALPTELQSPSESAVDWRLKTELTRDTVCGAVSGGCELTNQNRLRF